MTRARFRSLSWARTRSLSLFGALQDPLGPTGPIRWALSGSLWPFRALYGKVDAAVSSLENISVKNDTMIGTLAETNGKVEGALSSLEDISATQGPWRL